MASRAASRISFRKDVLDGLFPGRQDQFEVGAIVDVRAHGPSRSVDGFDRRQPDRQGQAEEIEIGVVVAAAAVAEDAEGKTAPLLGMNRTVEEGAARQFLAARRIRRSVVER